MTNLNKWAIALPFTGLVVFVLPAVATGHWLWFLRGWHEGLFGLLSASMWLIATAFVDVERPRGSPDLANLLMPLGLILAVPVAVYDRIHGPAANPPGMVSTLGLLLSLGAIVLGVSARAYLGRSYAPRPARTANGQLVTDGPYRWIRHPMYSAALLWSLGWPLIMSSLLGAAAALVFVIPALRVRMLREEEALAAAFGEVYTAYRAKTRRLVPYIY